VNGENIDTFSPDCVSDHDLLGGFAKHGSKAGAAFVRADYKAASTAQRSTCSPAEA
jgi:hypothetical protein